ncbi:MAG: FAD-dependent oxidoreductase [Promethearchaeota archaeon]
MMTKKRITEHPILPILDVSFVKFIFEGKTLYAKKGEMISSALFANDIQIFGHHPKDGSPQGIFCANGQCAQCMVIVNDKPVKGCMTKVREGDVITRCDGLPTLPADDSLSMIFDIPVIETNVLVIGSGPSGLSATKIIAEHNVKVIIIDDKDRLGGKLVLQTHKFFGSQEDVYAGKRGIEIADILGSTVSSLSNVDVWLNSTALAVFSDETIGVLKNNEEYVLVRPKKLLVATGAREKMLVFPGDTLPGVYGAGAFQTLVNRDLIRCSERIFIVGGGNVGLIAGYHALQADMRVVGLVEALPKCGGYKVHEDKLRRLGVPIYTSHTILSANGKEKVDSITIGQLDENWNLISGTEKSFSCDTILIAVGLDPVNEFYEKAKEFGMDVWVAGDAQEIAEASAAIFTGKIEGIKILKSMGIEIGEDVTELEEKAVIMKAKPPEPVEELYRCSDDEEGVFPVFHCTQDIPCNPCITVCPQHQINTEADLITGLPYYKGEESCTGCGRCVAVCPGLAITLVDYRKDSENPLVTIPYEITEEGPTKGEKITVMSNRGELGQFNVIRTRKIKEYPRTILVIVKLPKNIAKQAIGIKIQADEVSEPLEHYHKPPLPDEAIVCRCERVTAGEIRKWIQKGVTDINQLKALTHAAMGACGAKTCESLIIRIFHEEKVPREDITLGTKRPLFIEVPLGIFAGIKN